MKHTNRVPCGDAKNLDDPIPAGAYNVVLCHITETGVVKLKITDGPFKGREIWTRVPINYTAYVDQYVDRDDYTVGNKVQLETSRKGD